MKKYVIMKKILSTTLFLALTSLLSAQTEFKYGFEVGSNFAIRNSNHFYNYNYDATDNPYESNTITSSPQAGINAGVMFEISFNRFISLQPDIVFVFQNGNSNEYYYKSNFSNKNENIWINQNLLYLNVPVNVKFKFPITQKMKAFMLLGPSFNTGIFGTDFKVRKEQKSSIESDFTLKKEKLGETFGKAGYLSRFDFAINYGAGLEFLDKMFVSVEFNQGLLNLAKDRKNGAHFKNSCISINVGYLLNANEAKNRREERQTEENSELENY